MDTSTKEKDEEETTPADEETFPEEASEAEDAQLEDELAAKEAAAENEAASVPPDDPTMYLSVPKLGISSATVVGGDAGLELGGQLVGGYPWQPNSNTYIAGHRLGFPGTGSHHIFYNLPSMAPGDEVVLTDSLGQTYTYQVARYCRSTRPTWGCWARRGGTWSHYRPASRTSATSSAKAPTGTSGSWFGPTGSPELEFRPPQPRRRRSRMSYNDG
jgi:hypothetical protein